jgi:hypothetical protein
VRRLRQPLTQGVRTLRGVLVAFGLVLGGPAVAAELPVDLELVLAVDVSGSIDAEEARQQREGYVAAIADRAVVEAIGANFHRRIAVAYMEWASGDYQHVVLNWTLIDGAASAAAFAALLAAAPRRSARWTSISSAIDAAVPLFEDNGYAGERLVIDVSGDGPNNRGRPVQDARDDAVARGIVINGLPILNDRPQPFDLPTPLALVLDEYFAEHVIGGPGAFVQPAQDFTDFRTAILNKLIREIAGDAPPAVLARRQGSATLQRRRRHGVRPRPSRPARR